jgi:hypothetical protein
MKKQVCLWVTSVLLLGLVSSVYAVLPTPDVHWKFDENTGTTANNTGSAPGLTGTVVGATWTTGVFGSALEFNGLKGNPDHVDVPGVLGAPGTTYPGGLTYSMWAKWDADKDVTIYHVLFAGDGPSDPGDPFLQGHNADGSIFGAAWPSVGLAGPGTLTTADTWAHIAATRETPTNSWKLYVDSVYAGQFAPSDPMIGPLKIGAWNDGANTLRGWDGTIDDVRVYTSTLDDGGVAIGQAALDGSQIHELFNIPEPSSMVLLGLGGLMLLRRRRATNS